MKRGFSDYGSVTVASIWQRLREQPGRRDHAGPWRALPYSLVLLGTCVVAFFGLHWVEQRSIDPPGDGGVVGEAGIGGGTNAGVAERSAVLFIEDDESAAPSSDVPPGAGDVDALAVDDLLGSDSTEAAEAAEAPEDDAGEAGEAGEGDGLDGEAGSMEPSESAEPDPANDPGPASTGGGGGAGDATGDDQPAAEPQYFSTRPVGASLPSGEWCAARIKPRAEVRSMNSGHNATRGTGPNDEYPRVDGNFVGTTDEIIQWAACKWGIDEDVVRAQALVESWWDTRRQRDETTVQERCHPSLRTSSGTCPQSVGLMQVKYRFHQSAFEDRNAIRSTAYNIDYTYAVWRECFEGDIDWLNDVERGKQYGAGDLEGCLGVWFAGRWHTPEAVTYFERVMQEKRDRAWEHPNFLKYTG